MLLSNWIDSLKHRSRHRVPVARRKQCSRFRPADRVAGNLELLEDRILLDADFGDVPSPYPVTLAENGARHSDVGPRLGATRDVEADGLHSAAADADGADEDGVTFGTIRVGQLDATATINVQNAPSGAQLDAWIDFDGDGSWGGAGEQISFDSQDVYDDRREQRRRGPDLA